MALLKPRSGKRLLLKVSKGGSPEVWAGICTINTSRSLEITAETNDDVIHDCDDVDKIGWAIREKASLSMAFTGEGKLDPSNVKDLWDWLKGEDPEKCQVIIDDPVAANVITFEGNFHLTSLNISGEPGAKMTGSLSLASDGEITATFGANVGGE